MSRLAAIAAFVVLFGGLVGLLVIATAVERSKDGGLTAEEIFARYEGRLAVTQSYRQLSRVRVVEVVSGNIRADVREDGLIDLEGGGAFDESGRPMGAFIGTTDKLNPGRGPRPSLRLLRDGVVDGRAVYVLRLTFPGSATVELLTIDSESFFAMSSFVSMEFPDKSGVLVRTTYNTTFSDYFVAIPGRS